MAIISAAISAYAGVYYILILNENFQQNRMTNFFEVVKEIKKIEKYSAIIKDLEWLMNTQNTISHPEEILKAKLDNFDIYKMIDEIPDISGIKKQLHKVSIINNYKSLRITAETAIEKSETILKRLDMNIEYGEVIGWKAIEEYKLHKLAGKYIDLDQFDPDDPKSMN